MQKLFSQKTEQQLAIELPEAGQRILYRAKKNVNGCLKNLSSAHLDKSLTARFRTSFRDTKNLEARSGLDVAN